MVPIFDGPAAFILLGFLVALAAYLRQVSVGALDSVNNIHRGADSAFPYSRAPESIRKERVDFLNGMRHQLARATYWMFWLMVVLGVRIVLYALSRFASLSRSAFDSFRHWFDFVLSLAVLSLVYIMWDMHSEASNNDEKIRLRAYDSLPGLKQ